jgi:uncharacterized protein YcnI
VKSWLRTLIGCALFALATGAVAHVTVWPRESRAGGYEKYVVRVPTEGKVATTSIELFIPEGLRVTALAAGQPHERKPTSIVWTARIEPGEFAEFAFVARNPKEARELVWKATQRFADGTTTEWIGPRGDKRPASVTTLTSGTAQQDH